MKLPLRWTKNTLLFGGIAAWGLLLVSCVSVNRAVFAPPVVPGAKFVGSQACAECHETVTTGFHDASHAKMMAPGDNATDIGCESCHGPGSLHVKSGGGGGTIVNPRNSPETCYQCHLDKRAEFNLPSAHPVKNGQMSCSDCHEPHLGNAITTGGTNLAGINDTCLKCHNAQAGPYAFEHEAVREGCVTCHSPHGSVNARMLKTTNANLCLQCHSQTQTSAGVIVIGGRDHAGSLNRGTCWTAGCHEGVHGSHVNNSLRF